MRPWSETGADAAPVGSRRHAGGVAWAAVPRVELPQRVLPPCRPGQLRKPDGARCVQRLRVPLRHQHSDRCSTPRDSTPPATVARCRRAYDPRHEIRLPTIAEPPHRAAEGDHAHRSHRHHLRPVDCGRPAAPASFRRTLSALLLRGKRGSGGPAQIPHWCVYRDASRAPPIAASGRDFGGRRAVRLRPAIDARSARKHSPASLPMAVRFRTPTPTRRCSAVGVASFGRVRCGGADRRLVVL